jgi:hypothetical protein
MRNVGFAVLDSSGRLKVAAGGVVGNIPVTNLNGGLNANSERQWGGDGAWDIGYPLITQGRLTLTSGDPAPMSVTGAATLYFTPYQGNRIAVYNGTNWELKTFTEQSVALGALSTSKVYDVFIDNSLLLTVLPWTNDTTRGTALALQDGVYCLTGALTKKYLGTIRTNSGAATCDDSRIRRYVWNYYNRLPRSLQISDATASWTYTTATWRQANNAAANMLDFVLGILDQQIIVCLNAAASNSTAGVKINLGLALDSTTVPDITHGMDAPAVNVITSCQVQVQYSTSLSVGRHFIAWLEASQATGTTTFIGTSLLTAGGNTETSRLTGLGWLA